MWDCGNEMITFPVLVTTEKILNKIEKAKKQKKMDDEIIENGKLRKLKVLMKRAGRQKKLRKKGKR